ncbi:hypothetical protein K9K83_03645 [Candidatus Woesearchaeota archaeon]|nr:hypothetical protein [Candidatus Woesearchaeota archaeon]
MNFFKKLSKQIPDLEEKLKQASIPDTPQIYIKKTFMTATILSLGIMIVFFAFLKSPFVILLIPIIFPIMFMYFIKFVDVKITQIKKK